MVFYSDVNRQDNLVDGKVYDLEAVYQSIDTILKTHPGERLFLPEFGVDLEKYLFEPMTWINEKMMFEDVVSAITRWEPRVTIHHQKSGITEDPLNHRIDIDLVFSIKGKRYDEYIYQTVLTKQQKDRYYEL